MPGTAHAIFSLSILRRLCQLIIFVGISFGLLFLSACQSAQVTEEFNISVTIKVDHRELTIDIPSGSTVHQALLRANITLGPLDQTLPSLDEILGSNSEVIVTRVREELAAENVVIPFERQMIRNESIPEGETVAIQPGVNGEKTVTYRIRYEDGYETQRVQINTETNTEPVIEILMVGVQAPIAHIELPGHLVYLSGGNIWVMEGSSGNRRLLRSEGDLDGKIFTLSDDGHWLLCTRRPGAESTGESINTLWAISLDAAHPQSINLGIENVIHYAEWIPGQPRTIAYSTVEPRSTPPGWQANNDLALISFTSDGNVTEPDLILESNSGGVYGWWGTTYGWSPTGNLISYSQPGGVGFINPDEPALLPALERSPFITEDNWVWEPGLTWSPDGKVLYTVSQPVNPTDGENSFRFDLTAIPIDDRQSMVLVQDTGMFANPSVSPFMEDSYSIAFLQADRPDQSQKSSYGLMVVNSDGSDPRMIFPVDKMEEGLEHQVVIWSPQPVKDVGKSIAVVYQGNLWLVPIDGSQPRQLTGDGSIVRIDWK